MKEAVVFGAGSIGRGFIGELLFDSGYHTTFVEVNPELTRELQERKGYPLRIVGPVRKEEIFITNISVVPVEEEDVVVERITQANILFTAVGVKGLRDVAGLVAMGLQRKKAKGSKEPLNIIICENLPEGANVLREWIENYLDQQGKIYARENLGLIEAVVSRIVPVRDERLKDEDPLLILAEEYADLPVNKNGFLGKVPDIKGMVLYPNLYAYQERKLFTHNLGHGLCAYWGWQRGYHFMYQAVEDESLKRDVRLALNETGDALISKHGFSKEEHEAHIQDLLNRFANRLLGDTIERVGREPIRKLGHQERFIGGAKLAIAHGIKPQKLIEGICACLRYDNPRDTEAVRLSNMLKQKGLRGILQEVSGLSTDEPLFNMVVEAFMT